MYRPVPQKIKVPIEAIIFDLGNVLVDFDHGKAAERIARYCDMHPRQIYDLFFDSEITGLFEEGKVSSGEFFSRIKQMLALDLDYGGFLPIWNEIFFISDKNRQVFNLACALKKRYKMAVLSNINALHMDYLKNHFGVFDCFDYVIASYEAGCRKPHPAIYQRAIRLLNTTAPRIFYTDDRPELISGGKESGIKGFVFKDINQLKSDLISAGVNIN